jgi:hypothetical protein
MSISGCFSVCVWTVPLFTFSPSLPVAAGWVGQACGRWMTIQQETTDGPQSLLACLPALCCCWIRTWPRGVGGCFCSDCSHSVSFLIYWRVKKRSPMYMHIVCLPSYFPGFFPLLSWTPTSSSCLWVAMIPHSRRPHSEKKRRTTRCNWNDGQVDYTGFLFISSRKWKGGGTISSSLLAGPVCVCVRGGKRE